MLFMKHALIYFSKQYLSLFPPTNNLEHFMFFVCIALLPSSLPWLFISALVICFNFFYNS